MVAPKSAIVAIVASIAVLVAADCKKLYLLDGHYSIALYDTADCRKTPKGHFQIISGTFNEWFPSCHCHNASPSLNDRVRSFVFQEGMLVLFKDVGCPNHGKTLGSASKPVLRLMLSTSLPQRSVSNASIVFLQVGRWVIGLARVFYQRTKG
ncbi:hypothetical protein BV22DRAFT_686845 [Leucogyrophana mollusca]|uniref:Uncharacterized protein n=1 Tax=Leucogyrophana mollusca TaxID=85980 RepID=A0ACB8B9C0_9AGAM|nr:hypothetical protein BV22DRAFT_686845 [Leucogyrophana mollusca]